MRAWCALSTEPGPTSRRRLLLGVTALLSGHLVLATPAQDLTPPTLDVNRADRAELESLPGLGPGLVSQLLLQRQQAAFTDWRDLERRVRGLGPRLQRRLSDAGLRVQGRALDRLAPIAPMAPMAPIDADRARDPTRGPAAPLPAVKPPSSPAMAASTPLR